MSTTQPTTRIETKSYSALHLPTAVLGLDIAADGSKLYAACLDGGVYSVDPKSGDHEQLLKHDSFASGIVVVPGTTLLISAGYDGVLQWYDLAARKTVRKVQGHQFWSWQMALSPDGALVSSVTGQYLAGGPKYEPAPEREPSVKVFDARTGELKHQFPHVPPVLSVAFSPDSKHLAAGNLMGEVRVWELATGKQVANWTSSAFTSWGTVKSHCYQGGIYSMAFNLNGQSLFLAGMGPMHDPMAGNGKQTWQRYAWQQKTPTKVDEIHDGEHGAGHPESIAFHPSGNYFVMAGRLAQGKWNVGFFDAQNGNLIHSIDTKGRHTKIVFAPDGKRVFFGGTFGQPQPKDGKFGDYGKIFGYDLA